MLIAVILLAVLSVVLAMDLEAQQQEIERLKVLVEKKRRGGIKHVNNFEGKN